MSIIFLLVWFSGFFVELHPDAYRESASKPLHQELKETLARWLEKRFIN